MQEYWAINAESDSPELTWGAFKSHSREQYISAVAAVKAEQGDVVCSLEHNVARALGQYSASLTAPNFEHLSSLRRELHLHVS